jgi:hypothetical protein
MWVFVTPIVKNNNVRSWTQKQEYQENQLDESRWMVKECIFILAHLLPLDCSTWLLFSSLVTILYQYIVRLFL